MSERESEQIRSEIAAERDLLRDDLDALHGELRWLILLPFLTAGALALVLLLRRRRRQALRRALKLILRFL
jgi:hypothetical protein